MTTSIQTSILIDAPPPRVWTVLTDFSAVPSWNPFIREIVGQPRTGGRLSVLIAPPGKRPMRFMPTVLVAEEAHELRWRGHLLVRGILDGEHWFRLTPQADGSTLFEQGEDFSGLLVPILGRGLTDPTTRGFEAMNVALKATAEQGGPGAP
jgi:hypothetical protein